MNAMKDDMDRLQELVVDAARQAGVLTALADSGMAPEKLQRTLELASGQFERSALEVRKLCEKHSPGVGGYGNRPILPRMETTGFVEQFGYGWLHIQLNTLLPHCRYQTSDWLSDTIRRLLDEYVAGGSELPFFKEAMLVIDEHCGIKGRHIPAGSLVFSMLGVITLKLMGAGVFLPMPLKRLAQVLSGAYIGCGIGRADILELRHLRAALSSPSPAA